MKSCASRVDAKITSFHHVPSMFSMSFEFYRRDVIVKIILIIFVIQSKITDHMFTVAIIIIIIIYIY